MKQLIANRLAHNPLPTLSSSLGSHANYSAGAPGDIGLLYCFLYIHFKKREELGLCQSVDVMYILLSPSMHLLHTLSQMGNNK